MNNRPLLTALMLVSLLLCFSLQAHAQAQPDGQSITLYENPNFEGRSMSFGVGDYRLLPATGFNDVVSSIRVPAGLVVIAYEHSHERGGYGSWVDFLEDQPNLARYNFDNKISHLKVLKRKNSDFFWVRNHFEGGQFKSGYYQAVGRIGGPPPYDPNPVFGPEKPLPDGPKPPPPPPVTPPPPPPAPAFCTISGQIIGDKPGYKTQMDLLFSDRSPTSFSVRAINGTYRFTNVPPGTYEVRGKGEYRATMGSRGSTGLGIFSDSSRIVTCEPNGSVTLNFVIRSIEG